MKAMEEGKVESKEEREKREEGGWGMTEDGKKEEGKGKK